VPELVTIGGPSGIGKSSIIATALKTLQQRTVLLAVGKVDQFSPSLPYGVLSSAFRTLTLHLLGLPADEVAKWKIRLSRALEGYEALAVSLVPELGLLLESKPRFSADTFSIDARARFSHMVLALVKTFASQGCPLVLVLDDLQWSDAASLQTLKYLLVNCGAIPLLVVVAHRDICSLSDATCKRCWRVCRRRRKRERDCPAGAVRESGGALAGDGVSHPQRGDDRPRHADPREDGGNPLFVHEFFRRIVDDGLVVHNKYQDKWHYDLQAIRARHYTENVVTLVLEQLEELPDETRRLLGSIACLGGTGEMEMICRVVGMSMAEMRYALHPAVMAQLIVLTEKEYAFTHDRVQEAAFALLDRHEKSHLHLTTASLLADAARRRRERTAVPRRSRHGRAGQHSARSAAADVPRAEPAGRATGETHGRLSFGAELYPDRQSAGQRRDGVGLYAGYRRGGLRVCARASGADPRAVRCHPRLPRRADRKSAGGQPAGGSLHSPVG
jgi:hypothetical protein